MSKFLIQKNFFGLCSEVDAFIGNNYIVAFKRRELEKRLLAKVSPFRGLFHRL